MFAFPNLVILSVVKESQIFRSGHPERCRGIPLREL
jgi:hypothetical protein